MTLGSPEAMKCEPSLTPPDYWEKGCDCTNASPWRCQHSDVEPCYCDCHDKRKRGKE